MLHTWLLTPAVQHYPCSRKAETIFNILADCYPCSTLWHRMLLMPLSVTQSSCPYNFHRLKHIVLPLTKIAPYSSLCYIDCSPCLPLSHTDWSPSFTQTAPHAHFSHTNCSSHLCYTDYSLCPLSYTDYFQSLLSLLHSLLPMHLSHRLLPIVTLSQDCSAWPSLSHRLLHVPLSNRLLRMHPSFTHYRPSTQTALYPHSLRLPSSDLPEVGS